MYKTLTIVATLAVGASAYMPTEIRDHLNARSIMASISNDQIRESLGLDAAPKKLKAQNLQQGYTFDLDDLSDCARGFAYGLQFSTSKPGPCYNAVDAALDATDTIMDLLEEFYLPKNWAALSQTGKNYVDQYASINANCDVQKLLKTLTTDVSTLIPAAVARVGGAFIYEIPNIWNQMNKAKTCFDFSKGIGKIFAISFDYYI